MNEYEEQAKEFLDLTGTKAEFRYLETAKHFPYDEEPRDIYEIRLSRGSRKYKTRFGDSIHNTEKRIIKTLRIPTKYEWVATRLRKQGLNAKIEISKSFIYRLNALKKQEEKMKEWQEMTENTAITPYGILASIDDRANQYEDIDDFANEMGYDKISHTIEIWEAVKNESNALRMMYNDEELLKLQEIA